MLAEAERQTVARKEAEVSKDMTVEICFRVRGLTGVDQWSLRNEGVTP